MAALLVNKIVLLITVTIFVTLQAMVGVVYGALFDTRVTMINDILHPVTIHCKDKNHDDGFHILKPGDIHSINFKRAFIIPRALWFCSFKWEGEFHYFDIYVQKRDSCTHCYWRIQEKAMCRTNPINNENIQLPKALPCYAWNKNINVTPSQKGNNNTDLEALK
ncbi:hypothetical protein Lal_00021720 [Lupinus albus]|uniref:S-protein homolog n=1 Tax=Lupinus albus TaxID=3870 RepID=A0A6A5M273_LUPAL|nr:putative plant self-incompatibility S1 [Lupinus albus]KAF1865720.1 hypothetical protein Lal_00021720 [Lupinus albus]